MKKLAIAAAIATAAVLSTGAHAQVSSNITAAALDIGFGDIAVTCPTPFTAAIALTGTSITNPAQINFTGNLCLEPNGPGNAPLVALTFDLHGQKTATGTLFDHGSVAVYVDGGGSLTPTGFELYDRVDAQIPSKQVHCEDPGLTDGIQWAASPAVNNLAGVTCQTSLFGLTANLSLTGTNSF